MARIQACVMRIAWATHPRNTSLVIAASLFVGIGDLVGFVVNLNFAQRILRSLHPKIGWHPVLRIVFTVIYSLIVVNLCLLIAFTVSSYYTLDPDKHRIARDVELYGGTYFAFAAILPLPIAVTVLLVPPKEPTDEFGSGSLRSKVIILLCSTTALALGAWFRAGTSYLGPRPASNPAPYQSKTCFYIFYFAMEILVIWGYLIVRVDRRFYVPDGSNGPGAYSKPKMSAARQSQHDQGAAKDEDQIPLHETTAHAFDRPTGYSKSTLAESEHPREQSKTTLGGDVSSQNAATNGEKEELGEHPASRQAEPDEH